MTTHREHGEPALDLFDEHDYDVALQDAKAELIGAASVWPAFNSAHEGFGVLSEEVSELWDEVRVKQAHRDPEKLRREAIQVAAMAIRFAVEVDASR